MANRGGYPAPPMGAGQVNRPPGPGPIGGQMGGPQPRKIDPNQMPNPVCLFFSFHLGRLKYFIDIFLVTP